MTVLTMRFVDVAIFAFSTVAVWFVLSRGLLRSRLIPSTGRFFVVAGVIVLLVEQAAGFVFRLLDPELSFLDGPSFLPAAMPGALHWFASQAAFIMIVSGILLAVLQRKRAEAALSRAREEMIRAAQASVMESESRFRHLLDTTSNPVYCFALDPPIDIEASVETHIDRSYDASLIECNSAFVGALDLNSTAEAIGVRMGDLESAADRDSHARLIAAFVAANYRLQNYELSYTNADGVETALNISLSGIVEDGKLLRIWGSERDIQDLRATKSALVRRRVFQDLIAGISSYMIMTPIERAEQIIESCLKEISEFVRAERGSLLWIDWEDVRGHVNYRWGEDETPVPDQIYIAQVPYLAEQVRAGKVVRLNGIDDLPSKADVDRRRLEAWQIQSLIAMPLTIAGEVHGLLTLATKSRRKRWTDQDVLDLRVVAELFANFVSRLKSHTALGDALTELQAAKDRLEAENVYLREEIESSHGFDEIVGSSEAILRTLRMVEMVAETDTPVLILGETGTGKELLARAIHQRSSRSDRPLVKVNCATLPENLIESELFGYEKGAFTGADARKRGRFDLAHGSTLFLDEFGEMPLELQTRLLRVLQEGEFERLGGTETIKVDVRLIVATNRDLAESVRNGSFRSDLYYRVNTFPIKTPPLRERIGDIELLAQHFVRMYSKKLGRDIEGISAAMMRQLNEYQWPGNVRELEGVIQRAVIANSGALLELPEPLASEHEAMDGPRVVASTISDLSVVERQHIINVLESTSWKISGPSGAASQLGLPPSTLRSKMKKLDIVKPH
ncbi:MAG: sigma 54-interacting transcriptional regulator [Woeseiaceae bacterium]|nr:sigma 54-interacting transcriptional regulator [Woeseiaceae bacterium]